MISPLHFENSSVLIKKQKKQKAYNAACCDIKKELGKKALVLPLEKEIVEYLRENLF